MRQGPLTGLKILEFAGIGPGPFCGMLLSDLGADVVRIDRKGGRGGAPSDITARGRRSVALDLKSPASIEASADWLPSHVPGGDDLIFGYPGGAVLTIQLQRPLRGKAGITAAFGQNPPQPAMSTTAARFRISCATV